MTDSHDDPTQSEPRDVLRIREEERPAAAEPLDLEGVRRRDPDALAQFFERHFDRIYALAFRLLGERTAAEDAAQEVFLKVYRAAHQIDPTRDLRPWLTAITTNVCRDAWRSAPGRIRRRSVSLDANPGLAAALVERGSDPEDAALRSERERLVREALLKIREPHRAALVLREFEGLSYKEIAAILCVSEAAARKRYSRALAELGLILKESLL